MSDFWLGLLCGNGIGVFVGFIVAAMLHASHDDDEARERMHHRYGSDGCEKDRSALSKADGRTGA